MTTMLMEKPPECEVCKFRGRTRDARWYAKVKRRGWRFLCGSCLDMLEIEESRPLTVSD